MRGDPIVYCNLPSPVGDMIAGATNNGLCFLEWHDRGGVDRIRERVVKRYRADLNEGTNSHLKAPDNTTRRILQSRPSGVHRPARLPRHRVRVIGLATTAHNPLRRHLLLR